MSRVCHFIHGAQINAFEQGFEHIFLCTKRGTLATYVRVNITDFKDTFNILKAIGFFLVGTVTPTQILYRNS